LNVSATTPTENTCDNGGTGYNELDAEEGIVIPYPSRTIYQAPEEKKKT